MNATPSNVLANGWVLAVVMFLAPFLQSTLLQMYYYVCIRVSVNAQSALMSMIYHKALSLACASPSLGALLPFLPIKQTIPFPFSQSRACLMTALRSDQTFYDLVGCWKSERTLARLAAFCV